MKQYNYREIREITSKGILFKDGFKLSFEECSNEWAIEVPVVGRLCPLRTAMLLFPAVSKRNGSATSISVG